MKKKLLLALPLFGLLCSCSYGSIDEVTLAQFKNFYNSGDLKTRKDYDFKLGDDIEIGDVNIDGLYTILNNVTLSTSSISAWEKDGKGSKILFSYSYLKSLEEEEEEYKTIDGSLGFVAKKEYEEPEIEGGEAVLIGQSATYTLETFMDSSIEDGYRTYSVKEKFMRYEFYPVIESVDENKKEEFEVDPSYIRYQSVYELEFETITEEDGKRTTKESKASVAIDYYDYIEYGNKKALEYSAVSNIVITNEVYDEAQRSFVGDTRVTDKETKKTSYDERSATGAPKGSDTVVHKEEKYEDGAYVKDPEHSYEHVDDTYRYQIAADYTDKFEAAALVEFIKTSPLLDYVLNATTRLMKGYFNEFETYLFGLDRKEEIIHFGNIYQFRVRVSDSVIKQFSFYHEKERDTLTSIITFDAKTLTELFSVVVIY